MKSMDEALGLTKPDEGSKQNTPTASDVKACLERKTTIDLLAPAQDTMPGHTQVMMNLAGVLQPVWVPLDRAGAEAAGLKIFQQQPDQNTSSTAAQPPNKPVESAPSTPDDVNTEAPALANSLQKPDEQTMNDEAAAKATQRNNYMRFHRSVTSS
jgi:hypothetical protein